MVQVRKLGAFATQASGQTALKERLAFSIHAPNTHRDIGRNSGFWAFFHKAQSYPARV